jgi:hypothetical protein
MTLKKRHFFFATKSDLVNNIKALEEQRALKYAKCGLYDTRNYTEYRSIDEFDQLGINISGESSDKRCLVVDAQTKINVREIKLSAGGCSYSIDQQENPTSIMFWPGGLHESGCLIRGEINTLWDQNEQAWELYKFFAKGCVKKFKAIRGWYFGPEALTLAGKYRFITMTIKQPREYDFEVLGAGGS